MYSTPTNQLLLSLCRYGSYLCLTRNNYYIISPASLHRSTVVASPKSISDVPLKISTLEHIFFGWAQLEHINFVLLSNHCDVLRLGRRMGLPVVQFSSGSDATDLTYAWALQVVAAVTDVSSASFGTLVILSKSPEW